METWSYKFIKIFRMKIYSSRIKEVKVIEPQLFTDNRGFFYEAFKQSFLNTSNILDIFVQDNISKSYRGTIRGLHYQKERPQVKIVQCISGEILDVAVDVRAGSKTFGQYVAIKLSDINHKQLYIPEGFAHGFSVLSEEAIIYYKCSAYYNQESESGIRWDDPQIRINWGIDRPILSEKDRTYPLLESLNQKDLF